MEDLRVEARRVAFRFWTYRVQYRSDIRLGINRTRRGTWRAVRAALEEMSK